MTKDETSRYTDLHPMEVADVQYPMEVKSSSRAPRTHDAGGLRAHQISGIAWSGTARSRRSSVGPTPAGYYSLYDPVYHLKLAESSRT